MRPPARRIRRGGGGVLILLSTLPQSRGRKFASREGQSAINRRPRRRRPELRGRFHRPCGRRRVAVIVRRRRRQQSSAGVNPWLRTGGDRVSASSPRPHVHDNSPTPSPRLRSRTRRRGAVAGTVRSVVGLGRQVEDLGFVVASSSADPCITDRLPARGSPPTRAALRARAARLAHGCAATP